MEEITIKTMFRASSEEIYRLWLTSEGHSDFTGELAAIEPVLGSYYTAWNGYITGVIHELEENRRMLLEWRTTEFPDDDPNSWLEIKLENTAEGCLLTLKQWDIPNGQAFRYENGWEDYYFAPLRAFLSKTEG